MFQSIFEKYSNFHVSDIIRNRFQPEEFHQVLANYTEGLKVEILGESLEGRPIKQIELGSGPVKVLLWSQMHGNESTATRAILDLLKFNAAPGEFAMDWQSVLKKITIRIIPMVNPDGTARFTRRNAVGIDLNRDARVFSTPEARILADAMRRFQPDFGFNLHDQRRFYNVSGSGKPATISFLAPAFDDGVSMNEVRQRAMQLIAAMRHDLEKIIPGQVGLYDDDYSPRAFGDFAQALGISTVLIESGWASHDMEKEFVRQLNFALLVVSLQMIADDSYRSFSSADYHGIPKNDEKLFDVLISNVRLNQNGKINTLDLAVQRTEWPIPGTHNFFSKGVVEDIGDLAEWHGFEVVDAKGLMVVPGKVSSLRWQEFEALEERAKMDHLKQGNLFIKVEDTNKSYLEGPLNGILTDDFTATLPQFEGLANFLLINKQGEVLYVVMNGFLWPTNEDFPEMMHGLILS